MLTAADAPTIVHAFTAQADRSDSSLRLYSKHLPLSPKTDDVFLQRGAQQLAAEVHDWAALLVQLGVEPGDRIIHVSENRYEWIIADLAIQFARGIHVPVHAPLTGPQIARELYVSLNTLRTHTKRIFTKLDANTRAAAVRRAREQGLI